MMHFLGASSGNSMNSLSIKEANEHLAQMHSKMQQLEQRVGEQGELLLRRQAEHKDEKDRIISEHKKQIAAYQQHNMDTEKERQDLNNQMKQMNVQIAFLHHRCSYLEEAASYAPLLDQLSTCLKSSMNSMPPKVVSVKPTARQDKQTNSDIIDHSERKPNN